MEIKDGRYNCRQFIGAEHLLQFFTVFSMCATFIIPLVVIVIFYCFVIRTLWMGMRLERRATSRLPPAIHITCDGDSGRKDSKKMQQNGDVGSNKPSPTRPDSLQLPLLEGGNGRTYSISSQVGVPMGGLRSTHTEKSMQSKRRVIIMLVAIVIEFFVCWTPLYCFLTAWAYGLVDWQQNYRLNSILHNLFLAMAYASSCTNPITYCFLHARFRNAFLETIGWGDKQTGGTRSSVAISHSTLPSPTGTYSNKRLLHEEHIALGRSVSSAR